MKIISVMLQNNRTVGGLIRLSFSREGPVTVPE